jgi:hypothetical protein
MLQHMFSLLFVGTIRRSNFHESLLEFFDVVSRTEAVTVLDLLGIIHSPQLPPPTLQLLPSALFFLNPPVSHHPLSQPSQSRVPLLPDLIDSILHFVNPLDRQFAVVAQILLYESPSPRDTDTAHHRA